MEPQTTAHWHVNETGRPPWTPPIVCLDVDVLVDVLVHVLVDVCRFSIGCGSAALCPFGASDFDTGIGYNQSLKRSAPC